MAHTDEILVHGMMTPVTLFDSTAQEIDDAVGRALTLTRPNLLDNAHFYSPHLIDQRQGYVVPPDTAYYSDTGLATQAGTVSAYTAAVYVDGTYGTITVSGATYYVPWTAAVRGYVGNGYTVDRWASYYSSILIDGYIYFQTSEYAYCSFNQIMEDGTALEGQLLTLSLLYRTSSSGFRLLIGRARNVTIKAVSLPAAAGWSLATVTTAATNITELLAKIDHPDATVESIDIKAVKLELGDTQTLARQLSDGTWELIDQPPKPAAALAEVSRFYKEYPTNPASIVQVPLVCDANHTMQAPIFGAGAGMRINPEVKVKSAIYALPIDGGTPIDLSDATIISTGAGTNLLITSNKLTPNKQYVINASNVAGNYQAAGVTLALDANL